MRYIVLTEVNIKSSEDVENFKDFIQGLTFDRLILAGGVSENEDFYRDIMTTLPNDTIYLRGNSERRFDFPMKTSVEINDNLIWHGYTLDPIYQIPFIEQNLGRKNRTPTAELVIQAGLRVRGIVKGSCGDKKVLEEERGTYKYGLYLKGVADQLFHFFLRTRYNDLPENSMVGHFHGFGGKGYTIGDKTLGILEPYPGYTVLDGDKISVKKHT